jgi:hypothetical protein
MAIPAILYTGKFMIECLCRLTNVRYSEANRAKSRAEPAKCALIAAFFSGCTVNAFTVSLGGVGLSLGIWHSSLLRRPNSLLTDKDSNIDAALVKEKGCNRQGLSDKVARHER